MDEFAAHHRSYMIDNMALTRGQPGGGVPHSLQVEELP
jgi:hypothetical protein